MAAASSVAAGTFASAVHTHQRMVFSLAYHFLRDRSAAEEVAQDVFLELSRRYAELESEAHIVFWLRRVTSHRSIDYARRRRYRPVVGLDDIPEPRATGEPEDVLLSRKLRDLIADLPEKPRMVMVLRYQEDLMPEEIASVLRMPVRTVKSHLQRSLKVMRESMAR